MIRPFAPVPQRYSRLFPPGEEFPVEIMTALGQSTAGNGTRVPVNDQLKPAPAGYTYLGQFIDHDLSFDKTELKDATSDLSQIINYSGGRLDLNQLYGDGPGSDAHGHLYSDDSHFKLGEAVLANGEPFDIPPVPPGRHPAHPSNNENIILRQLHAMFLKLHNIAVDDAPAALTGRDRFEHARKIVRWQYQWLVREDFLKQVCDAGVFRALRANPPTRAINWTDGFSVPIEFAQAAYRFGHSMVRESYTLNPKRVGVPLETLFELARTRDALDPVDRVDWDEFFTEEQETSKQIDTCIVQPLHELSPKHSHHFIREGAAPELPPELPVRTLLRGSKTRLPTGELVEKSFGRDLRAMTIQKEPGKVAWGILDGLGLTGRTPLWYYILLEAELTAVGRRLGLVGSWLVADVIEECLWADSTSYLRMNPSGWIDWPVRGSGGRRKITRMRDVAEVTGLL